MARNDWIINEYVHDNLVITPIDDRGEVDWDGSTMCDEDQWLYWPHGSYDLMTNMTLDRMTKQESCSQLMWTSWSGYCTCPHTRWSNSRHVYYVDYLE